MGYILSLLLSIFPLLAWNKVREILTPAGYDAAMHQSGTGFRGEMMRFIALRLDAMEITQTQFVVASLAMALLLVMLGFLCDFALHEFGFGPRGNGGVLLIGASLAGVAWLALAPREYISNFAGAILFSAFMATLILVAAGFLKHVVVTVCDPAANCRATKRADSPMRPARGDPLNALKRRATSGGH